VITEWPDGHAVGTIIAAMAHTNNDVGAIIQACLQNNTLLVAACCINIARSMRALY